MGKKDKATQEKAKEDLAVLLEVDAQEQISTEQFEYEPTVEEVQEQIPEAVKNMPAKYKVHHNPQMLDWPTDVWGVTKDLKTALTSAASRIAGDERKKALVDEVLSIGMAHIESKYRNDKEVRAAAAKKV